MTTTKRSDRFWDYAYEKKKSDGFAITIIIFGFVGAIALIAALWAECAVVWGAPAIANETARAIALCTMLVCLLPILLMSFVAVHSGTIHAKSGEKAQALDNFRRFKASSYSPTNPQSVWVGANLMLTIVEDKFQELLKIAGSRPVRTNVIESIEIVKSLRSSYKEQYKHYRPFMGDSEWLAPVSMATEMLVDEIRQANELADMCAMVVASGYFPVEHQTIIAHELESTKAKLEALLEVRVGELTMGGSI